MPNFSISTQKTPFATLSVSLPIWYCRYVKSLLEQIVKRHFRLHAPRMLVAHEAK